MVYGVFGGHYSDWFVEGYFETEEEAQKYCAMKNSIKGRWQEDLYVIPLNKLNAEGNGKPFLYEFVLEAQVKKNNGKIVLPDCSEDEDFFKYEDFAYVRTVEYSSETKRPVIEYYGKYNGDVYFRIHIYSEKLEPPKKLCKIALDELTMEIATQTERDPDWMKNLPTQTFIDFLGTESTNYSDLCLRTLSNMNNIQWKKEE